MRRTVWFSLTLILFGPLPWIAWGATRALIDLERRDADVRATATADAFLATLRRAVESDDPLWLPLDDASAVAIRDGVLDEAIATPALARARLLAESDLVAALEELDRWVARSRRDVLLLSTDDETDLDVARTILALFLAGEILGHGDDVGSAQQQTLYSRARAQLDRIDDPATRVALTRYSDSLLATSERPVADAAPGSLTLDAWLDEVEGRPTSLGELALLARRAVELNHLRATERTRARADWPTWQVALREYRGEGVVIAPSSGRWFTVRGDRFREGPDVEASARAWQAETGVALTTRASVDPESDRAQRYRRDTTRGDVRLASDLFVDIVPRSLFGGYSPPIVVGGGLGIYVLLAGGLLLAIHSQLRRGDRLIRARDDLIARVAHELRTPLTVLRMYGETLESGRLPAAARDDYLRTLGVETRRLGLLVDRMTHVVRIEPASRANHTTPTIDAAEVVRGVTHDFSALVEAKGGRVDVSIDTPLPVQIDAEDLRLILDVLFDNALKYGDDVPLLDVRANGDRVRVRIELRDRGPGLQPGEEGRLFDRFARGSAGRAQSRGVGMGLFLARRAARNVGGEVTLENYRDPSGEGALATLTLPSPSTTALANSRDSERTP